jgi:hypothetical protein
MGEARERTIANGGILEPKGKAPAHVSRQVDFKAGVARDARAVAIQLGDILMHITPDAAEEVAAGLVQCARAVRTLQGMETNRVVLG